MQINPIYTAVNCAPIGYDDVNVTVRINPIGAQVDAYWSTLRALLAADESQRPAAEAAYEVATLALVCRVEQGDEMWSLTTRDELAAFSRDNDPQIVAWALSELWRIRGERVSTARASFRATGS